MNAGRDEEALELYRGDLLPGLFVTDAPDVEEWLEEERGHLRRRAVDAARALVARAEARGDLALAAQWARQVMTLAPDDESAVRRLMLLLDRVGDRAGAIRAYERFARRLAADVGAEPSAETMALLRRVRSAHPAMPPTGATGAPREHALAERYVIEREIARGGYTTVYIARDRDRDRPVLVKVVRPELAGVLDVDAFLRALAPASELRHPHVVPLEGGVWDAVVFYATPLPGGESLREKLEREHELPIAVAVRILRDMADALAFAHERGVWHHDLKPARVVVDAGAAAVTDMGVVPAIHRALRPGSESSSGVAVGSAAYVAPEQAVADPVIDHRADIYAMGAVAYALLTGRPPFAGLPLLATFAAQALSTPVPVSAQRASVSPALASLVMSCLEKRPADRPQSAGEVRAALGAIGRG